MSNRALTARVLACATAALACAIAVHAQNARSFVATTGVDTNNCTAAAWCRTFARALAVTNSEGEIIVVNSGGYSSTTISKAVTISAIGIVASIINTSGNALTINTSGNVTITGLALHGGGTGSTGFEVTQVGLLLLNGVTADGFTAGVDMETSGNLIIDNSRFYNNSGDGLYYSAPGNVTIAGSRFYNDLHGVLINNASARVHVSNSIFDSNTDNGFYVLSGATATVSDSSAQHNGEAGFEGDGGAIVLIRDDASENNTGVGTLFGAVQLSNCVITGNSNHAYNISGISGTITATSPGTNIITGTSIGTLSTATTLQ